MKHKIALILMTAVIAASGCVEAEPDYKEIHNDIVQFLEDDEDHKAIIGVIAGETDRYIHTIRKSQWKDYHDYTVKYYCFEKQETKYCELKEQFKDTGGF